MSPVLKPGLFPSSVDWGSQPHIQWRIIFSTDVQPKLRLENIAVALLTKNSIHQESFFGFERSSYNKLPTFIEPINSLSLMAS